MAIITIKATYSLDVETARTLASMAKRWRVSKSEALRRAIRAAAAADPVDPALDALTALQNNIKLDPKAARQWEDTVRQERLAVRGGGKGT